MMTIFSFAAAVMLSAAADSVVVLGQAVPARAIQPVTSCRSTEAGVVDSIATGVPGLTIVLFSDNTWKYDKADSFIEDCDVFAMAWDTEKVNPYQNPVDSLPEAWSVWMVDSLSSYHCPQTGRVTSQFGIHGRRHQGVDISIPTGTPLYAVFDGKVRMSKYVGGYGNLIVIRHNNGLETFYGHMSRRDLDSGAVVHAGDVIGLSGNTGRSTGPHLHFEARYQGLAFDPQRIIDFSTGNLCQRIMVLKRRYFNASSRYDQDFDDEFLNEEDDKKALEEKRKKDEEAARKAMVYHKVRNGENLGSIARKYHTTVNNICRLNGIKNANSIRAGRTLRVR
ncbi:MAG: peptidoglycan DD-metalloendopeptidase family protein [Bacteroidales bacterium]|nr:peptidoglycan DD-metalloendopeptidase family protein [Bacteroidales bacterium]